MIKTNLTFMDRLALWRAGRRTASAIFLRRPGPRSAGRVARGQGMAAGRFMYFGYHVDAAETAIFDLPVPEPEFQDALHGFGWLDDLMASGTGDDRARDWTDQWIERFGQGQGAGWRPDLLGARVRRWIDHADTLMPAEDDRSRAVGRSLRTQATLLARVWKHSPKGSPRIETLAGLLCVAASLQGFGAYRVPALKALVTEIEDLVAPDGTIASRNPERLAWMFEHLCRIRTDLVETDQAVPAVLADRIAAMAPVLRTLRHADGSLARFHGGGRGAPGMLDTALALSGERAQVPMDRTMGYARLSHGRTTVLLDAAPPSGGLLSAAAHASTLAFELTSGRRPLIVNCGSGRTFGDRWRRAGRATQSHSTLTLDGTSSARLGLGSADALTDAPRDVRVERRRSDLSTGIIAGHDGYISTHGLTHVRQLYLSHDGRGLQGEDVIATVEREDERIFDRALDSAGGVIPFQVRFHLHPDVVARESGDGQSFELMLKSGELWIFRHTGAAALSLEASVYLDVGEAEPMPAEQIVLSSTAVDYATRVSWTLAKARQTPDAVRDIIHEDRPVLV